MMKKKTPEKASEIVKKKPEVPVLERPPEPLVPPPSYYNYNFDAEVAAGADSRLHDYWRSARKHVRLVLGIMTAITTLAAFYMARQPDVYEAQAHIQVDLEANPVL